MQCIAFSDICGASMVAMPPTASCDPDQQRRTKPTPTYKRRVALQRLAEISGVTAALTCICASLVTNASLENTSLENKWCE
jgi:hypothetical protein